MAQDLSLAASCARPLFARLASPRYPEPRSSSALVSPLSTLVSSPRVVVSNSRGRAGERAFVLPKNFVSDSQKRSRLFLGFAGGSKTPDAGRSHSSEPRQASIM